MTQDLTDAYEIGAHTPGIDEIKAAWPVKAQAFRAQAKMERDLVYGTAERNRFDLFWPDAKPKGLMVFIHGGYWRITSKDIWSHLAGGGLARGWAVAMPSYTLAPGARISEITREVAQAVTAAADRVTGPIVITGHSAGGHLSSRMRCRSVLPDGVVARLKKVVPISPVADLRPLLQTAMNEDLKLDMAEAEAESPLLAPVHNNVPAHIWVGANERPVFLDQARWLSKAWNCALTVEPERHHFDVIDGLEDGSSQLMSDLTDGLT